MGKQDVVKTFKYLKLTKYVSLFYFLFCFISIMLFVINRYLYVTDNNRELFDIANATLPFWMLNPMVLIVSIVGFIEYLIERKDIRKREKIGWKWITFLLWNIGTIVAWVISVVCVVAITGGV